MLIGSNRKRESKVDLTVSILDHSISNVRSFKYLGIHISSDFTWTDHIEHLTGKINQRLGLLKRIKHLLPFRARLLFYKSLVMPLFEYADLVWGDKHNITLMSSLQVLQNKAAKVISHNVILFLTILSYPVFLFFAKGKRLISTHHLIGIYLSAM